MSLRARLTLGTACLLALAICAGFVAAYFVVRGQLRGEIDSSLNERANAVIAVAKQTPNGKLPDLPGNVRIAPPKLGGAAGYVQFVDASGKVTLPGSEQIRLPIAGVSAVASGSHAAFHWDATVAGTHVRIYAAQLADGSAIEIARPLTEVDHALGHLRLLFLLVSLGAVGAAAALGWTTSRTTLRPVKQLTDDAERIAATGDLTERTDQTRSDELGRLAIAFNTMLDALAKSVGAQRQLVADASHELRTPLASARANLEVIELHDELSGDQRRRIVGEALEELREMTRLIEGLVELARSDVHVAHMAPTRLDHIVEEVVAIAARRSGTEFHAKYAPTLVEGAPTILARAISNLLDNAIKWNPAGTPIDVTVEHGTVTVRDRGPGIDPVDVPHVFDRFYRASAARTLPGSGLGLAIVHQVAEAHGGSVIAEPAEGGGAIFTFRIPVRSEIDAALPLPPSDLRNGQ
ncbi:MAG: HAMP domain-containing histidine kinase [Actinomycetota bacterium]|nr:HAMP domain-containing histidine kinase [Actinomycetota bacterium]